MGTRWVESLCSVEGLISIRRYLKAFWAWLADGEYEAGQCEVCVFAMRSSSRSKLRRLGDIGPAN